MDVLLLDLDETLYPRNNGVHARTDQLITAWVAQRLGLAVAEADALRRELWSAHGTTLRGLVVRYGIEPADLAEVHPTDLSDLLTPDPELRALLRRLPGRKAVLTNAPRRYALHVLELLALGDAFEELIAIEDLALVPKPAPEAYARALARLGVPAARCTFVDDTLGNAASAARAGLRAVWLAPAGTRPEARADAEGVAVIESLAELESLLAEAARAARVSNPGPRVRLGAGTGAPPRLSKEEGPMANRPRGAAMKKYLLAIHQPGGTPPALDRIMEDVEALRGEMRAAGAWIFSGGLQSPSEAKVLRLRDGKVVATDGPFAESKEYLGGFTIVQAPDLEAALEWGRKLARATTLPIEVREFEDGG